MVLIKIFTVFVLYINWGVEYFKNYKEHEKINKNIDKVIERFYILEMFLNDQKEFKN